MGVILLGKVVIITSHPRPQDYSQRAGIVTADHGDGTVDAVVFNSQEDIRDLSMPVSQSLGNVPLLEVDSPYPTEYRGRWVAVRATESAIPLPSPTVAKPKASAPAKR